MISEPDLYPRIGSGGSADVFRLAGGRVLKLFRAGLDPGVVAREHDGVRHASNQGLRVARPLGLEERNGRQGIIFEELKGDPLIRHPLLRLGRTRAMLERFADYHARIHSCSGTGLVHTQHDIVHVRILHAETNEALKARALDQLYSIPRGDRLCHGDFHPGNALMTAQGIAVVDWSNASIGDPAGDVARTDFLFRFGNYGPLLRHWPMFRWIRERAGDFYLRGYRRHRDIDRTAIDAWWLPLAVSALVADSQMNRPALIAELAQRGFDA